MFTVYIYSIIALVTMLKLKLWKQWVNTKEIDICSIYHKTLF